MSDLTCNNLVLEKIDTADYMTFIVSGNYKSDQNTLSYFVNEYFFDISE